MKKYIQPQSKVYKIFGQAVLQNQAIFSAHKGSEDIKDVGVKEEKRSGINIWGDDQ